MIRVSARISMGTLMAAAGMMLAACTAAPRLDQVLASPEGQADPLGATIHAGYVPGSETYAAVNQVLAAGVRPNDPNFPLAVYRQISAYELQRQMTAMDPGVM